MHVCIAAGWFPIDPRVGTGAEDGEEASHRPVDGAGKDVLTRAAATVRPLLRLTQTRNCQFAIRSCAIPKTDIVRVECVDRSVGLSMHRHAYVRFMQMKKKNLSFSLSFFSLFSSLFFSLPLLSFSLFFSLFLSFSLFFAPVFLSSLLSSLSPPSSFPEHISVDSRLFVYWLASPACLTLPVSVAGLPACLLGPACLARCLPLAAAGYKLSSHTG